MGKIISIRPAMWVLAWGASLVFSACVFESEKRIPDSPQVQKKPFPINVAGLEYASFSPVAELKDGDILRLVAYPVKKMIRGREVRMLAYNGSIPGPQIRVSQGAEITIVLKNKIGIPTSLHSHGVRLDARYDGTPDAQPVIADGDSFSYKIRFPDPGLFWYHPHFREDYAKELGLYGNFMVTPRDSGYWYPSNREVILMLDDFYLDTAIGAAPFDPDKVDRTMMGRFGNVFLINGDTSFNLTVKKNELVRFFATNSCNTRALNIGIADSGAGIRNIKIVGSDNGQYEYFDTATSTLIAPSERKIFEAYFNEPGIYSLTHHILKSSFNNEATIILGRITVLEDSVDTRYGDYFQKEDSSARVRKELDTLRRYTDPFISPEKFLLLTGFMGKMAAAPKKSATPGEPISIEAKGIEWVDHMAAMNAASDTSNMRWVIRDTQTGLENHAINWTFKRGSMVKIRIYNSNLATHLMPHPIHFHGQRFLVVSVNAKRNLNLAWKDTYLVGVNETVEILLDASNPGRWMAQCHISEHLESMMMFNFTVE